MLKKYKEKFFSMIDKEGNKKNRQIENLVVFLVLLVITVLSINTIWKGKKSSSDISNDLPNDYELKSQADLVNSNNVDVLNNDLEKRLENILSKVDGVGSVSVMISYASTSEIIPMYNLTEDTTVTQETDSTGGKRTINESDSKKEIIYKEDSGVKQPVTQTVISPKITGVIVICEGGDNPTTKAKVTSAVEAVTGCSSHKIQVLPRKHS